MTFSGRPRLASSVARPPPGKTNFLMFNPDKNYHVLVRLKTFKDSFNTTTNNRRIMRIVLSEAVIDISSTT